jgi:hypothetical protein
MITLIVVSLLIAGTLVLFLFRSGSSFDGELSRYANHIRRLTIIEEIAADAIAADLSPWKQTCYVDDQVMKRFNLRPVNQIDGDYLLLVDYASQVYEETKRIRSGKN